MARRLFPNDEDRLVYGYTATGAELTSKAGTTVTIYTDAAATVLANILDTNSVSVPGSVLTVGSDSRLPQFYGPDGTPYGVDKLYAKPTGASAAVPIHARYDERIDMVGVPITCTSATRPTSPADDQLIYETDTDKLLVYSAATSSWTVIAYAGALDTWNPAYTNITVGNGTVVARYSKIGRRVRGIWSLTFGSTTAFTGGPIISLPVTGAHALRQGAAMCSAYDSSAGAVYMLFGHLDASNITPRAFNGTNGLLTSVNASTPFIWAVGDVLTVEFDYESAT